MLSNINLLLKNVKAVVMKVQLQDRTSQVQLLDRTSQVQMQDRTSQLDLFSVHGSRLLWYTSIIFVFSLFCTYTRALFFLFEAYYICYFGVFYIYNYMVWIWLIIEGRTETYRFLRHLFVRSEGCRGFEARSGQTKDLKLLYAASPLSTQQSKLQLTRTKYMVPLTKKFFSCFCWFVNPDSSLDSSPQIYILSINLQDIVF